MNSSAADARAHVLRTRYVERKCYKHQAVIFEILPYDTAKTGKRSVSEPRPTVYGDSHLADGYRVHDDLSCFSVTFVEKSSYGDAWFLRMIDEPSAAVVSQNPLESSEAKPKPDPKPDPTVAGTNTQPLASREEKRALDALPAKQSLAPSDRAPYAGDERNSKSKRKSSLVGSFLRLFSCCVRENAHSDAAAHADTPSDANACVRANAHAAANADDDASANSLVRAYVDCMLRSSVIVRPGTSTTTSTALRRNKSYFSSFVEKGRSAVAPGLGVFRKTICVGSWRAHLWNEFDESRFDYAFYSDASRVPVAATPAVLSSTATPTPTPVAAPPTATTASFPAGFATGKIVDIDMCKIAYGRTGQASATIPLGAPAFDQSYPLSSHFAEKLCNHALSVREPTRPTFDAQVLPDAQTTRVLPDVAQTTRVSPDVAKSTHASPHARFLRNVQLSPATSRFFFGMVSTLNGMFEEEGKAWAVLQACIWSEIWQARRDRLARICEAARSNAPEFHVPRMMWTDAYVDVDAVAVADADADTDARVDTYISAVNTDASGAAGMSTRVAGDVSDRSVFSGTQRMAPWSSDAFAAIVATGIRIGKHPLYGYGVQCVANHDVSAHARTRAHFISAPATYLIPALGAEINARFCAWSDATTATKMFVNTFYRRSTLGALPAEVLILLSEFVLPVRIDGRTQLDSDESTTHACVAVANNSTTASVGDDFVSRASVFRVLRAMNATVPVENDGLSTFLWNFTRRSRSCSCSSTSSSSSSLGACVARRKPSCLDIVERRISWCVFGYDPNTISHSLRMRRAGRMHRRVPRDDDFDPSDEIVHVYSDFAAIVARTNPVREKPATGMYSDLSDLRV